MKSNLLVHRVIAMALPAIMARPLRQSPNSPNRARAALCRFHYPASLTGNSISKPIYALLPKHSREGAIAAVLPWFAAAGCQYILKHRTSTYHNLFAGFCFFRAVASSCVSISQRICSGLYASVRRWQGPSYESCIDCTYSYIRLPSYIFHPYGAYELSSAAT